MPFSALAKCINAFAPNALGVSRPIASFRALLLFFLITTILLDINTAPTLEEN